MSAQSLKNKSISCYDIHTNSYDSALRNFKIMEQAGMERQQEGNE